MINKNDSKLEGKWIMENGRLIEDEICMHIWDLISHHLKKITNDKSGWNTLFQDTQSGCYWELTYEHSEMHGGGPPTLLKLSQKEAEIKYPSIKND